MTSTTNATGANTTNPYAGRTPATSKDVSDLLNSLTSTPVAAKQSAAEKARAGLTTKFEEQVRNIAFYLTASLRDSEDIENAAGVLRSLQTVIQRGTKVIAAIPDSVFESAPTAK